MSTEIRITKAQLKKLLESDFDQLVEKTAGVDHLTSNGTIRIGREIYRQTGLGRDDRMDRWLGLADGNVSVEARELCCRIVLPGGSFSKAAEKRKRRENVRRRGKVRRKRSGSKKAKRCRTRGSDPGYKEFKIVAFYDQSREHQHVAGTCGDHQVLGRLARREARRLKGSGMRWNVRNAQAVMALAALEHSGLWKTYWTLQCRLAA